MLTFSFCSVFDPKVHEEPPLYPDPDEESDEEDTEEDNQDKSKQQQTNKKLTPAEEQEALRVWEEKRLYIPDEGEGRRVEVNYWGRWWRAKTLRRWHDVGDSGGSGGGGGSGCQYVLVRWGEEGWLGTWSTCFLFFYDRSFKNDCFRL